jgi:hypothetical protein
MNQLNKAITLQPKDFYIGDNPNSAKFNDKYNFEFKLSEPTQYGSYVTIVKPTPGLHIKETDVVLKYTIGKEPVSKNKSFGKQLSITYAVDNTYTWTTRLIYDMEEQMIKYIYDMCTVDNTKLALKSFFEIDIDSISSNKTPQYTKFKYEIFNSMVPHLRNKFGEGVAVYKNKEGKKSPIPSQVANIKIDTIRTMSDITKKLEDAIDPIINIIGEKDHFGMTRRGCKILNVGLHNAVMVNNTDNKLRNDYINHTKTRWTYSSINQNIPIGSLLKNLQYTISGCFIGSAKISMQAAAKYIGYEDSKVGDQEDPYDVASLLSKLAKVMNNVNDEPVPVIETNIIPKLEIENEFYQ